MALVRDTNCYVLINNLEVILGGLQGDDAFERDLSDSVNKVNIS